MRAPPAPGIQTPWIAHKEEQNKEIAAVLFAFLASFRIQNEVNLDRVHEKILVR